MACTLEPCLEPSLRVEERHHCFGNSCKSLSVLPPKSSLKFLQTQWLPVAIVQVSYGVRIMPRLCFLLPGQPTEAEAVDSHLWHSETLTMPQTDSGFQRTTAGKTVSSCSREEQVWPGRECRELSCPSSDLVGARCPWGSVQAHAHVQGEAHAMLLSACLEGSTTRL